MADLITCSLALRCAQAWKRQKAALSEQGAQKLCHGSLRRQGGEWEVALLLGGSRGFLQRQTMAAPAGPQWHTWTQARLPAPWAIGPWWNGPYTAPQGPIT